MDEVKKRYPDLQLIDVVNEAIDGHQPDTPYFIEALGGKGKTGYDWLIKAFELAANKIVREKYLSNSFVLRKKDFQMLDEERKAREAAME